MWTQAQQGACFNQRLRAPFHDRTAGVLIQTAIALPILMMVIGFAADFGYASYINQRLARAADTAALSAVSQSAATAVGGYGNTSWLQIYGNSIFTENIKQLPVANVSTSLTVVPDNNGGVVATASYSYSVKAIFGGVSGRTSIPVSGSIAATAKPITYVNYYILVDTSQSMGIGTTQADMSTLYDRVASYGYGSNGETGCQFGCHVAPSNHTYTNEQLAHNFSPKVTLRIDSAVQAVQNIISTASSTVGSNKNIKFGLYMIQANPFDHSFIKTVATPSNDYATLLTQAATIDLGANDGNVGYGDTDFTNEFSTMAGMLPTNGSGASAASPLNFVFIITDGVQDTSGSCTWGHCTGPIDSTKCSSLKSKATVGVIYTTYLPITKHSDPSQFEDSYAALVAPFASQIAPSAQACATSTDFYFEATYGSDIISAVQALFQKTLPTTARLVQ